MEVGGQLEVAVRSRSFLQAVRKRRVNVARIKHVRIEGLGPLGP